ncbi:MAG: hypothetical protein ACOZB3_07465 [Calditrichota bacterium]
MSSKNIRWGITLGVVIIILLAALSTHDQSKNAPSTRTWTTNQIASSSDLISTCKEAGLLYRLSAENGLVFVDPILWNALRYDQKQNFVNAVLCYCQSQFDYMDETIYVHDANTNKLIAWTHRGQLNLKE